MFRLKNVSVSYGSDVVLKDVSLRIEAGEKVSLIGQSGAGKTTLLHKLHELERGRSAVVHQHYALVRNMSVFHNVYMGRLDRYGVLYNLRNLLRPAAREMEEVEAILESLGIGGQPFARTGELSGGQQLRVAVARAIYRGGDVLLADEPVSSIDPHQSHSILNLVMGSCRTVVVSLHSVELALKHSNRVVGLRQGKILFDLPPAEVEPEMIDRLYAQC